MLISSLQKRHRAVAGGAWMPAPHHNLRGQAGGRKVLSRYILRV